MHVARVEIDEGYDSRAEKTAIDAVKVIFVFRKDIAKGAAIVSRTGAGDFRTEPFQAGVVTPDVQHRLATVKDRVVRATNACQIICCNGVAKEPRPSRSRSGINQTPTHAVYGGQFLHCGLRLARCQPGWRWARRTG